MDYLLMSALSGGSLTRLVLSYDIACQWSVNFWKRMGTYPHDLRLIKSTFASVTFVVPKFHLPAHIVTCQQNFSFNLTPFVGRTEGEAPERGWADINGTASSTKEMGPGSRRDTLDDHFGDWNWKKITGLGEL
jgi:hypothetical protein